MITAQDIREKTFEKARLNGYSMEQVDDFLDAVAADMAAYQKESTVLKGKMKVLVDKIEEYRGSEDAMHLALVSAQKIAKDLEADAQAKADAIIAEAQAKADAILAAANEEASYVTGDLQARRQEEELRYQKAQTAATEYIQTILALTEREKEYLSSLKEADLSGAIVTPAPAEKKAIAAPAEEEPEAEEDVPVEEAPAAEEPAPAEEIPAAEEPAEFDAEPDFFAPAAEPEDIVPPTLRRPRPAEKEEPDYFKSFEDAVYGNAGDADAVPEEDDGAPMFRF